MKQLIEDYQRRLQAVTEELKVCELDVEKETRLQTKAICYMTFITELNREIDEKELFKPKKFSFKNELLDYGAEEQLVRDWLQVRKERKASNTQTALNSFIKEVEKTDQHINEILKICIDHSWKGFKIQWLQNLENNGNNTPNRFNNNTGNTKGGFNSSGKVSASTILAQRINQNSARNSESGNTTINVEIL